MATMQDVWNEIDRRDQATLEAALRAMGISTSSDTSGGPPASSGGLPIHNNLHHEPPLAIASDLTAHIATIADATTLGHVKGGANVEIAPDGTMSVTVSGFMDFLDLGDVDAPSGYVGQAGRVPRVKGDETGLELHLLTAADVGALTEAVADTLYDYLGAADDAIAAHVAELDPHPQYLTLAEADALFLTPAEGNAAYVALSSVSAFGFTLIDDADAATARTTLGLVAGGTGDIWVEKAGDTMTGDLLIQKASALLTVQATSGGANLTVQSDVGNANINFSSATNSQSQLNFNSLDTGVAEGRWLLLKNNDTESGSNVGANFEVRRRNDSGGALGTVFFLVRETGFVGINRSIAAAVEYQLDVSGTIRADATTGGILALTRADTTVSAGDLIGKIEYSNTLDAALTTKFAFAEIEARASRDIDSNAPTGRVHVKTTGTATGTDPVERLVTGCVRTLTDAATNLFDVTLNSGEMAGGAVHWTIIASDGTNHQAYSGITTYAVVNKAGTYTSQITHDANNDAKAVSSGTLTATWAVLNGTNKVTIRVTPTGSLTETTYQIIYTILSNSPQAITVLAV